MNSSEFYKKLQKTLKTEFSNNATEDKEIDVIKRLRKKAKKISDPDTLAAYIKLVLKKMDINQGRKKSKNEEPSEQQEAIDPVLFNFLLKILKSIKGSVIALIKEQPKTTDAKGVTHFPPDIEKNFFTYVYLYGTSGIILLINKALFEPKASKSAVNSSDLGTQSLQISPRASQQKNILSQSLSLINVSPRSKKTECDESLSSSIDSGEFVKMPTLPKGNATDVAYDESGEVEERTIQFGRRSTFSNSKS